MARAVRIEYPGAIYHVTARGNARRDIFHRDADRERFVEILCKCRTAHEVRVYLYCLMSNHFHLVVETPEGNLSRFMHMLLTAYSRYHNWRQKVIGHVFQGRYTSRLVHGAAYVRALSRYVHLNPVFAGKLRRAPLAQRVRALGGYRWSSYRGYVGLTKREDFVDYGPVLSLFGSKAGRQRPAYRQYVEAGIAQKDRAFHEVLGKSWLAIGSERFRAWVSDLRDELARDGRKTEDVSFRAEIEPLAAQRVLKQVARGLGIEVKELRQRRRNSHARAVAARMLCRFAGLSQRDCAATLGLRTGSAVSWQLQSLERRLEDDKALRRLVEELETSLLSERPVSLPQKSRYSLF